MNTQPIDEKAIFNAARRITDAARRAEYLTAACGNDPSALQRICDLLQIHAQEQSFLESPAVDLTPSTAHLPLTERSGTVIGHFKLLQQIGEGGMGVVFMAEQRIPVQRTVALKIIKPGMDSRQVIARFEAERQALAMMDHPNIARVIDAGTTDTGRPYFVMDLVRGVPITDFCDRQRLTVRQRLELFTQVCHAVQHAHQKGIIHRDLKPSNALVAEYDGRPVVKIIDFGVAKAIAQRLTERSMFTEFGQLIGTVEYMSPEQARFNQLDVDTRSDIYSLGVLLYELLAGSTPLEKERLRTMPFDEILRLIGEEDPPKPSTRLRGGTAAPRTTSGSLLPAETNGEEGTSASIAANRDVEPTKLIAQLRGELDWIVMKCLEKERDRRYQTASNLAADIDRYLHDQPVEACSPSATYRFHKFARRHKLGVIAGVTVAATVLLGVAGTTGGMFWALREQKIAQANAAHAATQAQRSDQVARFLEDMLGAVAPSVAQGRDTTILQEIVDSTSARIDKELDGQPELQAELRLVLAHVNYELQLFQEVERISRHALEEARERIGEDNIWVADALQQLGRALTHLREFDEATASLRLAVAMEKRLRGEGSEREATALCSLSDALRLQAEFRGDRQQQLAEAERAARESLAIRQRLLGHNHDYTAWSLVVLSLTLKAQHKYPEFEAAIREAHAIRVRLHGEQHPYTAIDLKYIGLALLLQGNLTEAESCVRRSLEVSEQTEGKATMTQSETHAILGDILSCKRTFDDAESHFRAAITIAKQQMGEEFLDLPQYLVALAETLAQQGKLAEASQYAQQAVEICRRHPEQVARSQQENAAEALDEIRTKLRGDSAVIQTE